MSLLFAFKPDLVKECLEMAAVETNFDEYLSSLLINKKETFWFFDKLCTDCAMHGTHRS